MNRLIPAALLGLAFATTAATAQPGLPPGKTVEVEFTAKHPYLFANNGFRGMTFDYPIVQGDRFAVEADAVNGVSMQFRARVFREDGPGVFVEHEMSAPAGSLKWTGAKGLPGRRVRVELQCETLGKVNVRITRLDAQGNPYPVVVPPDEVRLLRAEVDALKAQNALILRELADLRRLLEQKK